MFGELTSLGNHKLVANIFKELCEIMSFRFKCNLKYIALLTVGVLSKTDAIRYLLKLRKLNTLDSNMDLVKEEKDNIWKLIISQNNINNPDTHPIGSDLSIDLNASGTQKTLNIKQLDPLDEIILTSNNSNETNTHTYSFEYFAKHTLKLPSKKITPNINPTMLHGKTGNKSWVRIRLKRQERISDINNIIDQIYQNHPPMLKLKGIAQFNKFVYEFYYTDNNVFHCLLFFQNQPYVENIIFYSNLKRLKFISDSKLLTLSGIVKFYYCYNYKNLDFSLNTANDLMNLQRTYLYALIFMYKDNMDTSKGHKLNTAISCLSGNMPAFNIRAKSGILEALSNYEKCLLGPEIMKYIEDNKIPTESNKDKDEGSMNKLELIKLLKKYDIDLRSTSMSIYSLQYGMRHKIYKVSTDRDSKMFSKPGLIGGYNQHEVVLHK